MNLLQDPSPLAKDGFFAFASALWNYMTPVSPQPSMHEVMTGFYVPNTFDTSLNITQGFGTTTNIISQGTECNTSDQKESARAIKRATSYAEYCKVFSINTGTNTGCATMGFFTSESSSFSPTYWFTTGVNQNQCDLTTNVSGFSLYGTRDYMRCVCASWG